MQADDWELNVRAYHEAGHTVACRAAGIKIKECWINLEQDNKGGGVDFDPLEPTTENYRALIIAHFAGGEAQRLYDPDSVRGLEPALEGDMVRVEELLNYIRASPSEKKIFREQCEQSAREIVKQKRLQVQKLAAALIDAALIEKRLSGSEIVALIG